MQAVVTSIQARKSNYGGGSIKLVTFKGEDGKAYITWLDPNNGNYSRWTSFLKVGTRLDKLVLKSGNVIDADSFPEEAPDPKAETIEDYDRWLEGSA